MQVCPLLPWQEPQSCIRSVCVAGSVSAFAMTCCVYPLDTIKTRLQSGKGFKASGGFKGVYRGFWVTALGAMPLYGVLLSSYEIVKRRLEPIVSESYVNSVHVATACLSGLIGSSISVPIEIAKQRQQTNVKAKIGVFTIWKQAYKNEGIRRGLYRGFASTVMRDTPFNFLEVPIWELLKAKLRYYTRAPKLSSLESAACGVVAGGVAAAITTPFDAVKTRIVLGSAGEGTSYNKLRIKNVMQKIYSEAGIGGLFAGVAPRVLMFMSSGFIFYIFYEEIKDELDKYCPPIGPCERPPSS